MKALVTAILGFAMIQAGPMTGWAAEKCPTDLARAQAQLKSAQARLKGNSSVAKSQEMQAPRSEAGAKGQEIQAPRSQQEIPVPRGQDLQAPRSQDSQAPRSQEIQGPRVNQAAELVGQAEAACKKGDMALSAQKAKEALALMR